MGVMMSNTFTGRHRAVVKETGRGTPYIAFEVQDSPGIHNFDKAEVGMILDKSATAEDAQRIALAINQKMVGLFITNF